MSKHVIELNGKRYDAVSGALLGAGTVVPAQVAAKRAAGARQGRAIDGIVGKPAKHKIGVKPATPMAAHPKKHTVHRQPAPAKAAHQPERPKTLMRHVVKKPHLPIKPAIKTQAPAEIMAKPASAIMVKTSIDQVNPRRLARAKHVPQSKLVKRFDVAPTPVARRAHNQHVPVARSTHYATTPTRAAVQQPPQPTVHHAAPVKPQARPADIFEAALAHATSHQQVAPKHHRKHRRVAHVTAGIAAFLVIGGFVTYLNLHNLEVRVASVRAGFSAQLPSYKPTGYALQGPIESQEGKVRFSFYSGERHFTVTQQASNWNSQTLLDNAVALNGGSHQTIQSKGRTIYLYDNNHATWVNGGVRYDITGNAALNPNDVASIASSM